MRGWHRAEHACNYMRSLRDAQAAALRAKVSQLLSKSRFSSEGRVEGWSRGEACRGAAPATQSLKLVRAKAQTFRVIVAGHGWQERHARRKRDAHRVKTIATSRGLLAKTYH